MNITSLELVKGEDVKDKIYGFIKENQWKEALIIGGIGSLEEITVANPQSNKLPIKINKTNYKGPLECVSFTGEIKHMEDIDDDLKSIYKEENMDFFVHIHVACSYENGQVVGGGLHKARVFRALRLMLVKIR